MLTIHLQVTKKKKKRNSKLQRWRRAAMTLAKSVAMLYQLRSEKTGSVKQVLNELFSFYTP